MSDRPTIPQLLNTLKIAGRWSEGDCLAAAAYMKARVEIAEGLDKADVLRGRICRLVCFGVGDEDLQKVYDLCGQLEKESLARAAKELEGITGEAK